ncbi:hypothetical protein AWC18_01395 [Mycolicibacter nonchromogenicus]|uniref:Thymidylate kinase n=1 Tax=Mycolicibacter nonchromogenicus TaxID=1782 RepID=A0A1X1ZSF1_MYCNO|nr:AAA family ATPase [Mycolicibacter nonchromogenicus]ORW26212.1 hypothetical protein AWC18_01395 [Mycolicibacter nonchromogenicus]
MRHRDEHRPIVVAVEGYDGAGKTTLTRGLREAFESRGLSAIEVGRGAANSNAAISTLTDLIKLSDGGEVPLDPSADVFVRLARTHERIKLILETSAELIILDRFVAYDLSRLDEQIRDSHKELFDLALKRFQLDLTIFLNAPFDLLWNRVLSRGVATMSAKEKRGIDHNRIGYDSLIATMAWWSKSRRVLELDCTTDINNVLNRSLDEIDALRLQNKA